MASKGISVTIKGVSALLMHRYPMVPVEAHDKLPPSEQAEIACYRMNGDGSNLYLPGVALLRAVVGAASYSKGKARASLVKPVAACVFINPEQIDLGVNEYIVDSRPVVIPATKGRIVRHRPRIDNWSASFEVEYDNTMLTEDQLRRVFDDCGSRVGLLDFRPEKKGPFGRFMVTEWKS